MTRQLYELKHPLYPHPDLLKYHNEHGIQYRPSQGSYDSAYNNWYQLVRADHDLSGAPKRPIYREISQIIRLRSSSKEYLLFSETLYGQDHEYNTIPFFHTYGMYSKPTFKKVFNYETKQSSTLLAGGNDTIYFIPFDKKLLDELYTAGPDDKDIELLLYVGAVGSKQYGGRGFWSYEDFRDLQFEELARQGREGKGMFTQPVSQIPVGTMAQELRASGGNNSSQLYNEFLEFQKFKQAQQVKQQQQSQSKSK